MSKEVLSDIEQRFVSFVSEALDAVKMSKEPEELNRYRKLFKKHVPLTMRSYVAAFMAREVVAGKGERGCVPKTQRAPFHQGKPKIVLSEEESKVLFFSVGRKRGVGPKDIITLLMQNVELPREHIGEIKILDNYCFVQVKTENADAVIAQLNNFRYRGRSLSVSYATVKTEKSDDVFSSQQDDNSSVAMPDEEQVGSQEI